MISEEAKLKFNSIKEHLETESNSNLLKIIADEQDWYESQVLIVIQYVLLERGISPKILKDANLEFQKKHTPRRDLFAEMLADPEYRRYLWTILIFIIVVILGYVIRHYDTNFIEDTPYH